MMTLIFALIIIVPSSVMAQIPCEEDFGHAGNTFDVTFLNAYDIDPAIADLFKDVDQIQNTDAFTQAFDEIMSMQFGAEENIYPENVEFLKALRVTMFGLDQDGTPYLWEYHQKMKTN